jgi:hypothetical protein
MAMILLKDKSDNIKPSCLNHFIDGKAQNGNYYQATTFIPDYVSSSSQLSLYTTILKNEVKKRKQTQKDGWYMMDNANNDNSWISGAYENGESGNVYFSSED